MVATGGNPHRGLKHGNRATDKSRTRRVATGGNPHRGLKRSGYRAIGSSSGRLQQVVIPIGV